MAIDRADILAASTATGSRMLSYSELKELLEVSLDIDGVVNAVEAYEVDGDVRYLRCDATLAFSREDYGVDQHSSAQKAYDYIVICLDTVDDREELKYTVWLDNGEK
ncbi:hypothetical protein [Caulobacter sp. LARHSG274]